MDKLTKAQRSANMAKIRAKDTKPEMTVRRMLHALGYRFRLHGPGLPGKPDVVFPRKKLALFIHGCFWHQHENCKHSVLPKSRPEFWLPKLKRNKERDTENIAKLQQIGWQTMTVWECETRSPEELANKLKNAIGEPRLRGP